MGLDQPLFGQYLILLGQVAHGDFAPRSISVVVSPASSARRFPATIELAVLAMLIAGALGSRAGLFLFHVRGSARSDRRRRLGSVLPLAPEFLWDYFHPAVSASRSNCCPSLAAYPPTSNVPW